MSIGRTVVYGTMYELRPKPLCPGGTVHCLRRLDPGLRYILTSSPGCQTIFPSSTVGFWGFIGFKKLLSRARVALDHRPIVVCAVDVFLG